ncbi:alternative ribosome rescue aminoacyl-tRNA hydrolase ArfB [Rhodospirillum sp. A1_3_36]|uniref:alternative ribosome rescue aminoacyl-tRNA hydrolase ArfB n=1 Tax=Rhodospirillum sp. A1_3_36 TaxID=3391666 RepID=UPI0039A64661
MIPITGSMSIDESELEERFIRASGPGGQNVNKVSSAVQLRFDALNSPNLSGYVKRRLPEVAGSRMTSDGVIIITAQAHRAQETNRREAVERLVELLRLAAHRDKPRRPTKPTKNSQKRRMDSKTKRGVVKKMRQGKPGLE